MKTNKIILTTLSLLITTNIYAETHIFQNGGATYNLAEKNAVELFKEHMIKNKDMINKKIEDAKKKALTDVKNYKPKDLSITLPRATKNNIFYPDPIYVNTQDIKDAKGNILYPKGYKFNPLHYISLDRKYVFIDYADKEQVKWLLREELHKKLEYMIIVTNGNVFDAMKKFNREVFYVNDLIIKRFELQNVPAVVEQIGDRIKVEEFKIKEEND